MELTTQERDSILGANIALRTPYDDEVERVREARIAAWALIKANRPPNGQVMYGPLREAIDLLDPVVTAALNG